MNIDVLKEITAKVQEASMNGQAQLAQMLEQYSFDINKLPREDSGILSLNGELVGSRGNILSITGKAKSRKSVMAGACISAILSGHEVLGWQSHLQKDEMIIHIDTEQGYDDYYKTVVRMINTGGYQAPPKHFKSIHERAFTAPQRLESLEILFKQYKPSVCVVDGVRDLLTDFNSNEETDKVISALLRLSLEYDCLIVCIIHVTKGHGYMRGALGTALEDKSETVIKVEKDENEPNRSTVEPQYSRHKDFEKFAIIWDDMHGGYIIDEGYSEVTKQGGRPKKTGFADLTEQDHKQALSKAFANTPSMSYSQLTEALKMAYKVGANKAKEYIRELQNIGLLLKDDKLYYRSTKAV